MKAIPIFLIKALLKGCFFVIHFRILKRFLILNIALFASHLSRFASRPPFDLIFIDADKPNNPSYLRWALRYSRPGTVIVGDNVVRDGEVTNPDSADDRVQGVRAFIDMMGSDPRLTVTALQTVGSKGWDGFTLAWVNA